MPRKQDLTSPTVQSTVSEIDMGSSGVPTNLDRVAREVVRLYQVNGDVDQLAAMIGVPVGHGPGELKPRDGKDVNAGVDAQGNPLRVGTAPEGGTANEPKSSVGPVVGTPQTAAAQPATVPGQGESQPVAKSEAVAKSEPNTSPTPPANDQQQTTGTSTSPASVSNPTGDITANLPPKV